MRGANLLLKDVEKIKNTFDMHLHSLHSSDGSFAPAKLISLCRDAGIKTAALCDHNSVAGVMQMLEEGKKQGIEIIPACEFDCVYSEKPLHILGYGINPLLPALLKHQADIAALEKAAEKEKMLRIAALGFLFDEQEVMRLSKGRGVSSETVAKALLTDSRNDGNPLLFPYRDGGARSDNPYVNFYWDFCSPKKAAHTPINFPTAAFVISLIKQAGGVAVLAHPNVNIGRDEQFIAALVRLGICGIEAYSSYHTQEDIQYFLQLAEKLDILVTLGSDFHGETKPAVRLGGFDLSENTQRAMLLSLRAAIGRSQSEAASAAI